MKRRAAVLSASLFGVACAPRTPDTKAEPPAEVLPGGTGSFVVVPATTGPRLKLYLPRHPMDGSPGVVSVVDVSAGADGGAPVPALLDVIPLRGSSGAGDDYATITAGDSTTVIAASSESPLIWFIDPTRDALTGSTELALGSGQSTFAGNGGYVTSMVIDGARHRAILGVWNGFSILDLSTQKVTRTVEAPPSENFAFDPVHDRIIAPFYDCASSVDPMGNAPASCGATTTPDGTPMTDGLNVIDLNDDAIYTFENAEADDPAAPVGASPGSAAADPRSGLVVVPSKDRQYQTIIDLSRASFDRKTHQFTAPSVVLRGNGLPDVAVAPDGELVFWEGEDASDIAVGALLTLSPDPADAATENADGGSAEPEYVFGLMPAPPGEMLWKNVTTSHGVAVWPGTGQSGAFGITVSHDYRWVARVDLKALLALPASYHEVDDVSSAVTLLDAQTKP